MEGRADRQALGAWLTSSTNASPLPRGRAGQWSVRVSGNWRVVFRFEEGEVVDVDLVDYH